MLYYYDHTPQDDPAGTTAVLPAAEPEPTAPPEAPAAPPRRKKDRSERPSQWLWRRCCPEPSRDSPASGIPPWS